MIKRLLLISMLFSTSFSIVAQDLNVRVQVLSPKVQNTNKRTLETLQKSIEDFLNNTSWSNRVVHEQERIDASLLINITEWDGSSAFKAEAQVRSNRPVYNSSYNSPVLALSDRSFNFTYQEGQPLDYSDQQFTSSLSSLLAFYAYVIIGADADTFLPSGGNGAFQRATQVVANAQSSGQAGWSSSDNPDNRYWLSNNLTNREFEPIRKFNFQYHTEVLDKMSDNKAIVNEASNSFNILSPLNTYLQNGVYKQVFFSAKSGEFIEILKLMDMLSRLKSINLLKDIDPANAEKYEDLRKLN